MSCLCSWGPAVKCVEPKSCKASKMDKIKFKIDKIKFDLNNHLVLNVLPPVFLSKIMCLHSSGVVNHLVLDVFPPVFLPKIICVATSHSSGVVVNTRIVLN